VVLGSTHRFAAHESATRTARLRVELSQSRIEQKEYLKNVELARVLAKRGERRRAKAPIEHEDRDASLSESAEVAPKREPTARPQNRGGKRPKEQGEDTQGTGVIDDVLLDVF
jgi:ESF2/ABP1 family protein